MHTSAQAPVAERNPDIAGIGICASIYGFSEYQPLCSSWMANVNEADTLWQHPSYCMHTSHLSICTGGNIWVESLSCLIVLNLSWINNMGLSGFALIKSQRQGEKRKEGKFTLKHLLVKVWFHKDFSHHVRWPVILAVVHLCVMATLPFGFGLRFTGYVSCIADMLSLLMILKPVSLPLLRLAAVYCQLLVHGWVWMQRCWPIWLCY
jgi:hypothetical protein